MLDFGFQIEMVLDLQKLDALAVVFLNNQSEGFLMRCNMYVPLDCLYAQRC